MNSDVPAVLGAFDPQIAHVWCLSGGKIVKFQQYTDTSQWAKAAGAQGGTEVPP